MRTQTSRGGAVVRTPDGDVVWVLSDGGHRQLFHVADGFELSVADPEGAGHAGN